MPEDPDPLLVVVAGAEVVGAAVEVVAGAAGEELVDDELELDPQPAMTSTARTSAPDINRRIDLPVFMGLSFGRAGQVFLLLEGPTDRRTPR